MEISYVNQNKVTWSSLGAFGKNTIPTDSSGVYICKSVINDLRHGNYICKSEVIYLRILMNRPYSLSSLDHRSKKKASKEWKSVLLEITRYEFGKKRNYRRNLCENQIGIAYQHWFQWSLHMKINSKWFKTWILHM